jgi:hypothetical protein
MHALTLLLAGALAATGALSPFSPASAQRLPNFRVTSDPASSRTETYGGRNVVVADGILTTADERDGNSEIFFRERLAGAWQAPVRLTTNAAVSVRPAIGRVEDDVPEVWTKHESHTGMGTRPGSVDPTDKNARHGPRITRIGSAVSAWVIPTDEELVIARHMGSLLGFAENRTG